MPGISDGLNGERSRADADALDFKNHQFFAAAALALTSAAAFGVLVGLGLGAANGTAPAACAPKDFDSAKFIVCTFDPRHDDIRLFLSGPDDKPYGSIDALAVALKAKGEKLAFAMNAGMFGQDQLPVGLYV